MKSPNIEAQGYPTIIIITVPDIIPLKKLYFIHILYYFGHLKLAALLFELVRILLFYAFLSSLLT